MSKQGLIALVGRRSPAIKAAGNLEVPCLLIHDCPIPEYSNQFIQVHTPCNYEWSDSQWQSYAQELGRQYPDLQAVVALTEKAVIPAAIICQTLKLSGSSLEVANRCTDKAVMKTTTRQSGIPCANFMTEGNRNQLIQQLGLPMIIKPRNSSGSRGIWVAQIEEAVPVKLDIGWMAEAYIQGTEFSVESFVQHGEVIFTNCTEYVVPKWINLLPAVFPPKKQMAIETLNRQVITAMGVQAGMTHLELFDTPSGLIFGEIAIRPPGGHIMALIMEAYGFDAWQALLQIYQGQLPKINSHSLKTACVQIFHPGAGRLEHLDGIETARHSQGITSLKFKVNVGDQITSRIGVGQEIGNMIACGKNREETIFNIRNAEKNIQISLKDN